MTREFVSTNIFDRQWEELGLSSENRRELENQLIERPTKGDVIPGTNGIRKIRIPWNCKGTRGGARIIYIDYCQYGKVYLIGIYKKNVKTDLSSDERKSTGCLRQ